MGQNISNGTQTSWKIIIDSLLVQLPYAKICALLEYYAASSGKFFPTFRDNLSVPSSRFKILEPILNPEDGTERLSRNVGNKVTLLTA